MLSVERGSHERLVINGVVVVSSLVSHRLENADLLRGLTNLGGSGTLFIGSLLCSFSLLGLSSSLLLGGVTLLLDHHLGGLLILHPNTVSSVVESSSDVGSVGVSAILVGEGLENVNLLGLADRSGLRAFILILSERVKSRIGLRSRATLLSIVPLDMRSHVILGILIDPLVITSRGNRVNLLGSLGQNVTILIKVHDLRAASVIIMRVSLRSLLGSWQSS